MAHQAIQLGEVRQMPATAIGQRLASAHLNKTGDCMLGQFGTAMNMGLPLGCSQPRQPRWAHCETVLLVVFFLFSGQSLLRGSQPLVPALLFFLLEVHLGATKARGISQQGSWVPENKMASHHHRPGTGRKS